MKKLLSLCLITFLCLILVGCGKEDFLGNWSANSGMHKPTGEDTIYLSSADLENIKLQINKDKTFTFNFSDNSYEGKYKVDDKKHGSYDVFLNDKKELTGGLIYSSKDANHASYDSISFTLILENDIIEVEFRRWN